MSELDHLKKKPPDDGGLLLDTKDRRLKRECQECGVKFFIGPEETSQQASNPASMRVVDETAHKFNYQVKEHHFTRSQVNKSETLMHDTN